MKCVFMLENSPVVHEFADGGPTNHFYKVNINKKKKSFKKRKNAKPMYKYKKKCTDSIFFHALLKAWKASQASFLQISSQYLDST